MTIPKQCTLFELVQAVNRHIENDTEAVALISYLINSGRVQLRGNFAGAKVSLSNAYLQRNRRPPTVSAAVPA